MSDLGENIDCLRQGVPERLTPDEAREIATHLDKLDNELFEFKNNLTLSVVQRKWRAAEARIQELEKEKLELNEQLDALQKERDEAARDLAMEQEHHQATRRSEEALAAHVEWVREASVGLRNLMTVAGSSAEHYLYKMFDALEERPETSLARLKAQWQTEALEDVAMEWRRDEMDQDETDCVEHLERKARRIRRQAEGGET